MSESEEIDITSDEDKTEKTVDSLSISETSTVSEGTTESETEGTTTTETFETTESLTDVSSATGSQPSIERKVIHLTPQDILGLPGRHIRAEDFKWRVSPIPNLSDIIIEKTVQFESSNIEKFLKTATEEQRNRILEILPLDLPVTVTLPLIEEGPYWKRMCLKSWPAYEIWRYSNDWKSMFVHRNVHDLLENFNPEEDDIKELCDTLAIFSDYVTSLQVQKLSKATAKIPNVDLSSDDFDECLDEIISAPQSPIYLDFEGVFGCLEHLQDLGFMISPKFMDHEDFHLNTADFNSLFRGLHKLRELRKFRVSNRLLSNEQTIEITKAFLKHRSLVELHFSYNFIDNSVCDYIAKLLISECPLEVLVLKYNKISDDGAKSIAAALSENSKLKKLDISLNRIGDEGGSFLARVLHSNKSLTDLDVSKNKMAEQAGLAFASLIKESNSLTSLKIQENCLGETAGKSFSNAVKENHNLLELKVNFCAFRNEDEDLIHEYIFRNRLSVPYSRHVQRNNNITAAEFLF